MEGLFKIVPIEGKGVGWVALQEIKVGTLILSEKCQLEPVRKMPIRAKNTKRPLEFDGMFLLHDHNGPKGFFET